mgnify:CR=1 FL=1
MGLPKFFVAPGSVRGSFLTLEGENAAHARVLRLRQGDRVLVCDGCGTDYSCTISDISPQQVCLVVDSASASASEPRVQCSVYMAYAKADKLEHVIQKATELGAALWLQFAVFLVVSILALIATRPLARKMLDKTIVPTNADRVLHHEAKVTETVDNENATGAVYIDGKTWTARSEDGNIIPKGKMARIVRMEGVKLYVRESKEPSERRE